MTTYTLDTNILIRLARYYPREDFTTVGLITSAHPDWVVETKNNVADEHSVECINFLGLLGKEGWSF